MLYDEMREYLSMLRSQTGFFNVRIDWSVIKINQIIVYSAGKRMGLQIADAIATSFFYAVQRSAYGFTEDRYARILKSVVYRHKGRSVGYGLKFWPREVDSRLKIDIPFEWIRREYQ